MLLSELIKELDIVKIIGNKEVEINEIKTSSSEIAENGLFIALKGTSFDGHNYYKDAIKNGAKAIICEKALDTDITQIIVKDCRVAYSKVCSNFYNNPQKELKIIGVTGTNGKTSTTHLITAILTNYGIKCGLIGTLGIFYDKYYKDSPLTTPDPLDLFKTLREMCDKNVEIVIMEVSAHASHFKKVFGIDFEVLAFTNLTQDHLDFFNDIKTYEKAKLDIFIENKSKYIVTNVDDETGKKICESHKNAVSYGINNPSDVFSIDIKQSLSGTEFIINLFDKVFSVKTHLLGLFNVYNAMCAITVCALVGIPLSKTIEGLKELKGISGRLDNIYDKKFSVFIDYAHTPDGIEKSLLALRPYAKGKLICVFGCGGNRDAKKRSIMGEKAGKNADFLIITTDNPRYEEPMQIIYQIEKGAKKVNSKYVLIEDRKEAIRYALSIAKDKDVVLIAGKGSEKYQEVLGVKKMFSDKETTLNLIKEFNDL